MSEKSESVIAWREALAMVQDGWVRLNIDSSHRIPAVPPEKLAAISAAFIGMLTGMVFVRCHREGITFEDWMAEMLEMTDRLEDKANAEDAGEE